LFVRQKFQKSKGGVELGKIYAIDFDGTLCKRKYPKIGDEIPENIDFVKQLAEDGHELILWTCREGDYLQDAVDWCKERGLEFDAINENLSRITDKYGNDCRKVFADYYIDDKNYSIPVDTEKTRQRLLKKIDSMII
jgi:hydroxymethylpyrimidine pyrophosphatase-like HAD family hydrolase